MLAGAILKELSVPPVCLWGLECSLCSLPTLTTHTFLSHCGSPIPTPDQLARHHQEPGCSGALLPLLPDVSAPPPWLVCFSPKAFTTVCPCIKLFLCLSYPSFLTTVRDWGQFLSVPLPVPNMAFKCTPSVNRYLLSTYWALAERRGSKPQNVLTTLRPPFCTPFPRAQQLGRGQ